MDTLAVVLEEPETLVLEPPRSIAAGRRGRRRRHRVERHQHRHRAPALDRQDAAVPRHGLSAGARLRVRRARPQRRGRRPVPQSATACSCPARAASARCADSSAARPARRRSRRRVVPIAEALGERGRAARARRHRVSRDRTLGTAARARPHRRPRRARPAAGAPRAARGGERPIVWERNPDRARRRASATRSLDPAADARRDYRAIYDVSGDASLLDTLIARLAPGGEIVLAGFYSEPLVVRVPAGVHARSAHPHRRGVAGGATSSPSSALAESGRLSLDGLITHRQDAAGRARRLPHGVRRSRRA